MNLKNFPNLQKLNIQNNKISLIPETFLQNSTMIK